MSAVGLHGFVRDSWAAPAPPPRSQIRPDCRCRKGWRPGLVLDPFFGAGTVGLVAEQYQRDWFGIEINPEFARLAGSDCQRQRDNERGANQCRVTSLAETVSSVTCGSKRRSQSGIAGRTTPRRDQS